VDGLQTEIMATGIGLRKRNNWRFRCGASSEKTGPVRYGLYGQTGFRKQRQRNSKMDRQGRERRKSVLGANWRDKRE